MKLNTLSAVMAALLIASANPTHAHHSFAVFDLSKTVNFKGTVKDLQWTNPHVWIRVEVLEKDKPVTYEFECAAIAVLKRAGWMRDTVKPGDAITVVSHPYKDGRPGGSVDHLILKDGTQVGSGDAIPGALTVPGAH